MNNSLSRILAVVALAASFATACGSGSSSSGLVAPTGLQAKVSGATVQLSWTPGSTDQDMFMVMRKLGTGSYDTNVDVQGTTTSYTDSSVSSGKAYTYMIMAMKGDKDSDGSNEVTVDIP